MLSTVKVLTASTVGSLELETKKTVLARI